MAWKMTRSDLLESGIVPDWVAGVMPSFLPAAFMPLILFATPRVVRLGDFMKTALAIGAGMGVYEIAQIWRPERTFDWQDLVATVAGTGLACLVGRLVFFCGARRCGPP